MKRNVLVPGAKRFSRPAHAANRTAATCAPTNIRATDRERLANNDYMFATDWLAERLVKLPIYNGDGDPAWTHSDHAPLVATFAL